MKTYDEYVNNDYMEGYNLRDSYYKNVDRRAFLGTDNELYKHIIPKGSVVLDVGCGNGTLGGFGEYGGVYIEGLDRDVNNKKAVYHSVGDVKGNYNYILLSQILEHNAFDNMAALVEFAKKRADHVIIGLPNGSNPFAATFFFNELTHVKNYDSDGFLHYLEKCGLCVDLVYHTDLDLCFENTWAFVRSVYRCLHVYMCGFSPFNCTVIVCTVSDEAKHD